MGFAFRGLLRGACPEQNEILRYARNDKKRRVQGQNDKERRARNDGGEFAMTKKVAKDTKAAGNLIV